MHVLAVALSLALLAAPQDEVVPHNQDLPPGPPLPPAEAQGRMQVPPGFRVELVASEPDLENPVAMCFDERGRIWVTESVEYPRTSAGVGRDRVKVLEDTDGDGYPDRITVFADGLNIPSGIAVGHGGAWVANAPDLLFLADDDGDGVADRREVVVTGFGRSDTHELPNSLTWGPDGWLYGLNGVFNPSRVVHGGREHRFTAAMFRVHPRTRAFELFAEGTSNPWGIAFDDVGSAFISACVIDHLWHIVETGYYHRQAGAYPPFTWKIESIVDHNHQKRAYCGLHYFDSDAYPERYRRRLYMGNIHGNCVNVDRLERDGASYVARAEEDFLVANDAWFMPVSLKTGPDGCLYVLDWYDRYHCHQDALRDPDGIHRGSGRLWRVRYEGEPPPAAARAAQVDLGAESDDALIGRLTAASDYERQTALRLLGERDGAETRAALSRIAEDAESPVQSRLSALWALVAAGPIEPALLLALLNCEASELRSWAVRAAGEQRQATPEVRERIVALSTDPSPDVLLQVAIAAPKLADVPALDMLLRVAASGGEDELIQRIVWRNLEPLLAPDDEEREVRDGELAGGGDELASSVARTGLATSPAAVELLPRAVERLLADGAAGVRPITALLEHLTATGADAALARCFAVLASQPLDESHSALMSSALRTVFRGALAVAESDAASGAARLAAAWGDEHALALVRAMAADPQLSDARRIQALESLVSADDAAALEIVPAILADPSTCAADFRDACAARLALLDDARVADSLLRHYALQEPALRAKIVLLLTQRVDWSVRLLDAVGSGAVPAADLRPVQVTRLLDRGDVELTERIERNWGQVRSERDPLRERVIARMRRLIRSRPGDATAGKEVFARVCGQCHVIHGEGRAVGPDLTDNGRSSFDQLLSNVFDPGLAIGAAYVSHVLRTKDGRLLNGLLAEESERGVALIIEGGERVFVPRADIETHRATDVSLMAEGFELQLTEDEIVDLFAFLTLDRPPTDPAARRLAGAESIVPRETDDPLEFAAILAEVAPGFTTGAVGDDGVALEAEYMGRPIVVRTHPVSREEPCILRARYRVPDTPSTLQLDVAHHPRGDWRLVARLDGRTVLDTEVGASTASGGWASHSIDLSEHAGKAVEIALENHATGWSNEYAYWGRVELVVDE